MGRHASTSLARRWLARGFSLALVCAASPGVAAVFHVGTGCTYTSLQAAVNAAKSAAGADTIAITGNLNITSTVTVRDPAPLTIEGGYASCGATTSNGSHSTLDANNLSTDPLNPKTVIYQTSDNGSGSNIGGNLTLKHLNIRNANANIDPNSDLYGAAIQSVLPSSPTLIGTLNLIDVSIDHNQAGYGAGIWIEGDDQTHAKLNITDSLFEYNNANFDGGGIYASKTDVTISGNTELNINIAGAAGTGGNGGGIFAQNANITVKGHTPSDRYFLNSNTADNGGGLYLSETSGGPYQVTMQNDRADQPLAVYNNTANVNGGGFYLETASSTEEIITTVSLWNMIFDTNFALDGRGAALYISAQDGGGTFPIITTVDMSQSDAGGANPPPCVSSLECNAIRSHESTSAVNYGAAVAVFQGSTAQALAGFHLSRGRMRDNLVNDALISGNGYVTVDNSLVASNTSSHFLFETSDDNLTISNSTIADNALPASQSVVYALRVGLALYHNLVDQPNATVCTADSPVSTTAIDLGVSPGTGAGACNGTNVQTGFPSFVDPANINPLLRDFHLKFSSEAIDRWTPATSSNTLVPTVDLDGFPRPHFGLATFPYDFGAYEFGSEKIFANGFESP